jgi:hypothetical protein
METPAEIQARVEEEFDLELKAVRELDSLSDSLLDLWSERGGMRCEGDRILSLAIARGTTTFKAAIHLIEGGFGREALMLNRSMFEGMAVAHWIAANPDEAAERFAKANEFEIHLMREKVRDIHPDIDSVRGPGELDATQQAEAEKLFGRGNQLLWTGHRNLWDLVKKVESQWEEPGRSALIAYLKFEHERNTKLMHASASAIFDLILDPAATRGGRPGISVRIGPGSDSLEGALLGVFFNHTNLLSLLVDHFELGEEAGLDVKRLTIEKQFAFAVIDALEVRDTGRNDPCPCGSGSKFKTCHWDRVRRRGSGAHLAGSHAPSA